VSWVAGKKSLWERAGLTGIRPGTDQACWWSCTS